MSDFEESIRLMIEGMIDNLLSTPNEYVYAFSSALRDLGVDPNTDRILSYIAGMITGSIMAFEHIQNSEETPIPELAQFEYFPLIKRRISELRAVYSRYS